MKCAWKELLAILPPRWRDAVDRLGVETAQNIRLRINAPPELCCRDGSHWLPDNVSREDLDFVVNTASRYSPWAAASMAKGYITAPGGHRIGLCGEAVIKNRELSTLRNISSLCIRVARDIPGVSEKLESLSGSILILGAPGWGKTTLLRDLIRQKSCQGLHVSVVDEREELFPAGLPRENRVDVLLGCEKAQGIEMLLRTMEPRLIAMDEITAEKDCQALMQAAWCGVTLIATAHASSLSDYLHRDIYSPLVRQNIFSHIVILRSDKSWYLERSKGWTTNGSARY